MRDGVFEFVEKYLISKVNPSFIIIFGSYAKGVIHKNSDLDVAFHSEDYSLTSY